MKKSLLALAVLGAFAGTASAQSNVTIYGVFDIGLVYTKNDAANSNKLALQSGNWSGSRLGFKGSEDLGGGLSAIFQLENGFSGDTGALGQGGRIFGRQAYVGLQGGWGAVKLGRQYMPAFLAVDSIDPFGTGLSGDASGGTFDKNGIVGLGANIFANIDVRTSNAIDYSISAGGFSGELQWGLGEVPGNTSANRSLGGSLGYGNGPINAVLAYHEVKDATGNGAVKATILGGTYNFGPAIAHLGFDWEKNTSATATTLDARSYMLGVTVPLGAANVFASYIKHDDRLASNIDSNQAAIGASYAMSKRTNFYTSYGHINTDGQNRFDIGIRHKF